MARKAFVWLVLAYVLALTPAGFAQSGSLSPSELAERTIHRRAVEAVIWGMAAVNVDLMFQAMERETKGTWNQIVYWSRPLDWKNQTLTPNPNTIYLMPFFSTKDGPMVLEIPPAGTGSITGSIMDTWQMPLADVGPAGVDKGVGGKYLILPPGYSANIPDGYIPLPSQTYYGYALLRSELKSSSDADVAAATAYGRRVKLYPLTQASKPADTVFHDAIDVNYDATIPYDLRYFQALDRVVQRDVWLTRDKVMIDQLKSIGIEKGKPFKPDESTQRILNAAAAEAKALLAKQYEDAFSQPFFDSSRWALPLPPALLKETQSDYSSPDSYPVDDRGFLYTWGFFTPKQLGSGSYYLLAIKDKNGDNLGGANTYRLTVPANAPVKLYWSATAYDRATHTLIRGMTRATRSPQNPELQKNVDGSVDLYFGPAAPKGKESNWIPTDPKGEFELVFRLYGPEPSFFDKKWVLPDLENVAMDQAQ